METTDKAIIILSSGPSGRVASEIFEDNGQVTLGFLETKETDSMEVDDKPILGQADDDGQLKLIGLKCDAFVGIDDGEQRKAYTSLLAKKRKVVPKNAFHASAIISRYAQFGHGNLVQAGCIIQAGVEIDSGVFIHPHAVVEAGVKIGSYATIHSSAVLGSEVTIGEGAIIGAGAVIVSNTVVGAKAYVAPGSLVLATVEPKTKVHGNPAKPV